MLDRQIKLYGRIKKYENDEEVVAVRLPVDGILDRTLIVTIPGEDDDDDNIPCYLQHTLLHPAQYNAVKLPPVSHLRNPLTEICLYGKIRQSQKNLHNPRELIAIDLPVCGLYDRTLLVNMPSDDQQVGNHTNWVVCYLKHRILPEEQQVNTEYHRRSNSSNCG